MKLKDKAINFLHKGKFKLAEKYFRQHYKATKNKWEFYNSLGNVFRAAGKNKKAEIYYKKSLKIKPKFGLAWSNLSAALANQKKYRSALEAAEKAIKILPREMGGIHKNLLPLLKKETRLYKGKIKSEE